MANESNLKKKNRKGKNIACASSRGTSCIEFCFEIPCGNHSCSVSEKSGEKTEEKRKDGPEELRKYNILVKKNSTLIA